jgi:hypothetical protein
MVWSAKRQRDGYTQGSGASAGSPKARMAATMRAYVESFGPVRRRPMSELIYEETWAQPAPWAFDPPGTTFTAAGPPKPAAQVNGTS